MLKIGSFIIYAPELFCCAKFISSFNEKGNRNQEIVSKIRFALQWVGGKSVNGLQFISKKSDMLWGLNAVEYSNVASFHWSNGAVKHFFFKSLTRQSCKCKVTKKVVWHIVWLLNFFSLQKTLFVPLNSTATSMGFK